MNYAVWIRRLALLGAVLCFCVVVFGAYTRLSDAGLGCPDWPGCYGHITPTGAANNAGSLEAAWPGWKFESRKAWIEMIHRYAATTLGFVIVVIAGLAIAARQARVLSVPLALALLGTVVLQGMLGMLTVTWLLKPLIVTGHLIGGLTTLALLVWVYGSVTMPRSFTARQVSFAAPVTQTTAPLQAIRRWVLIGCGALTVQILLGGWTSTNYAAMACPDFPQCQGQWLPQADYRDAFVLWRGLDINYAGGVLDHPARVAIHFSHRLGAILATLALLLAGLAALRGPRRSTRFAGTAVLVALALQLALGIAMVLRSFPLELAAAHNAGAALLVIAVAALLRSVLEPRRR